MIAGMVMEARRQRGCECTDSMTPARREKNLSTSQFQCDDATPGSIPTRNGTPRPARARCASAQPSPPDTPLPGQRLRVSTQAALSPSFPGALADQHPTFLRNADPSFLTCTNPFHNPPSESL